MVSTWLAAAALAAAISVPGALSTETQITAPVAAPVSDWTRVALTDAPARWRTPVCAGVTGVADANAQYMVDRVSQRALELGLRTGAPGCTANLLVVFTTDPSGQAQAIARERTDPASVAGRTGRTAGLSAFNDFVSSTRPVRWWRVTRTMTENGEMADRNDRLGEAPRVNVQERGRLASPTTEVFSHVIVIVDLAQVNGMSLGALSDYVAMVALAPVDAQTEPSGASILRLFDSGATGRPAGLTDADMAYLRTVYR